ncbi:MAG: alpha-2-macroglobulin family protein, partial [Planctomycetaceae bacterium]
GGKVYSETREVVVPPEKRVVNVSGVPNANDYKPGAPANVQLKLTDIDGKPIVGSTALTVYDKSVEYISGGSNVPEIREFFWKWRRHHLPQTYSSLNQQFHNLLRERETGMGNIGVFGDLVDESAVANGGTMPMRARQFGAPRSMMAKDGAMPESAAPAAMEAKSESGAAGSEVESQLVQPTVRSEFADTAYWAGSITADENGLAEISLKMPENLTTWKIRAWTMAHGTKVGQGEADVVTSKKLLVRLQAPRFFVEKDEVVLSANVHNYLDSAKSVKVSLELEGKTIEATDAVERTVEIPAGGEKRVDWRVKVVAPGEAVVRMKALTDEESDAMQMKFPVRVHGMLKTESFAGSIRPDKNSSKFGVDVPAQRRIRESRLEIRYSPTLAGAMVDALPYLVSYPHETTDCTLTRFVPTVITQNILKRMNVDLADVKQKRTNLNAQEIGDDAARAAGWKRYDQNPVFDNDEVAAMVKQNVQKLTDMQLSDGGWGWFFGWGEYASPYQSASIVHGLQIAQANDVALVPGVLEKGIAWLKTYQAEQVTRLKNYDKTDKDKNRVEPYKQYADNIDALVYMVLVDAGQPQGDMREFLYRDRTHISVYAKAMYGLALHKQNETEKLAMILENIDQYLVQDDENQTAYLKMPEGSYWWFWYDSEVESNAYYLKLLAKTDPKGEKASRLVKYLLNNRKHATYWQSTRDTALAIEALAEFLVASGEDKPDMTLEVWLDGKKHKEVKINADNLFSFDNKFVLEGDAVESGTHTVELKKQGTGPVYYCAYLTNFTLEEQIDAAGLEVKVNRKYYKLTRKDQSTNVAGSRGQVVEQRVEKYERTEIPNLGSVNSGDLVEIELEIDSKNDYEHIIFEDKKAAGFEPFDVRSGYNSNSLGAYMQLRDEQVTFFVRRLARGNHSVSYRMRAETPGKFSALPTVASGMYAPELRGNSDEIKIRIEEGLSPRAESAAGE